MRHKKKGRQLGRKTKHRWALFRNLVTSLLEQERIETTEAKAKEIRGFTDRMITLGKEGSLPARRRCLEFLAEQDGSFEVVCRRRLAVQRPVRRLYQNHSHQAAHRRCGGNGRY